MSGVIERYLAELERALPRGQRRRIVEEVRTHLYEAAREHGEQGAVERFGRPAEIARRFADSYTAWYGRLAAYVTVAAVALYAFVLYPIPENALPPAPWPEDQKPEYLAWKQHAALVLFMVAAAAAIAAVAAGRRNLRLLAIATTTSIVALVATAVLGTILGFQWAAAVAGTPPWLPWLPPVIIAPAVLAALLLGRARAVHRRA